LPTYTSDSIALGVIAEGRRERVDGPDHLSHPEITVRGIQIALATGLVESNLTMYANYSDPESLRFPHDAVGSDANSIGVFQQRDPWWGTCADRMDVARSAAMFYHRLAALPDYDDPANSPGSQAQAVQRSAFPDRYDGKFKAAQALYKRLSGAAVQTVAAVTPAPVPAPTAAPSYTEVEAFGNGASSRSRPPRNFLLHTQEGDGDARSLARFCDGSNNVSYHYTLRDGVLCDVVDTDYYSWSVLDANAFTINLCFAGSFAGWDRGQWLARKRDIEIAAFVAVQDARKYGFPAEVIAPEYRNAPGIADHRWVTQCLGIGTHTDVGDHFPWDVFSDYVNKYANGGTTGTGDSMANVPQEQWDQVYQELTKRYPSRSPLRHLDEGLVDTETGMILNTDGNLHVLLVKSLAELGDTAALELLAEVAAADPAARPERARDAALARAILADIESTRPQIIRNYLATKKG
jgi:hypothetical protein